MQTPPQSQVATPNPPPPKAPVTIKTTGPRGEALTFTIPRTAAEMEELQTQREELSNQLTNVSSRRSSLASELEGTTDGAARTGLEERLGLLDKRILQLETDLATTGRQISSAPAELIAETTSENQSGGDQFVEGVMLGGFSVAMLGTMLFLVARRYFRRSRPALPESRGESTRLERLEVGMDAIAIEIERISEGQRFVTRLLSEAKLPIEASSDR